MNTPLLQIEKHHVSFETENRITHAVQDISFSIPQGVTLAIVVESGSGKSVSSLDTMRILRTPKGKIHTEGKILFNTTTQGKIDLLQTSEKEMQRIRGKEISMIFQEPMTALNPLYTCGAQLLESILQHQKLSKLTAIHLSLQWI